MTESGGVVDVVIEDNRWTPIGLAELAQHACAGALAGLDLDASNFEIALLGCDDVRISQLNGAFRDKPTPTNVLSWPAYELAPHAKGHLPIWPDRPIETRRALGDIAIAYDTCAAEAADQNKAFGDHVTHLLVHATLHLLGYDHESDEDAAIMEAKEVEILANAGIEDPY